MSPTSYQTAPPRAVVETELYERAAPSAALSNSRINQRDVVGDEHPIGRHERQALDMGLSNKSAIKGVAVVVLERRYGQRMTVFRKAMPRHRSPSSDRVRTRQEIPVAPVCQACA